MPCRTIGYNTFMLYIITALSAEARPIINHFRLKKVENTLPYPLFSAENVHLLLTQVGYENSALYRATKTGLRTFGQSLFEEVRKDGVNVLTINPYMTDTAFSTICISGSPTKRMRNCLLRISPISSKKS